MSSQFPGRTVRSTKTELEAATELEYNTIKETNNNGLEYTAWCWRRSTPTLAWVGVAGLAAAHYALQVGANNLAL